MNQVAVYKRKEATVKLYWGECCERNRQTITKTFRVEFPDMSPMDITLSYTVTQLPNFDSKNQKYRQEFRVVSGSNNNITTYYTFENRQLVPNASDDDIRNSYDSWFTVGGAVGNTSTSWEPVLPITHGSMYPTKIQSIEFRLKYNN